MGFISVATAKCSVWLGPDHLLSVDRVWFTEEYKRFYFRDIQLITVEQTRTALLINYILAMCAAGTALLFWLLSTNDPTSSRVYLIIGGILTGIFLIALAINLARGPSCVCRLKTAVQTELLPALGRTGSARRTLAIIKPLIEQAQGTLEHGLYEASAIPQPISVARPSISQPVAAWAPQAAARTASGYVPAGLYGALFMDALAGFYKHIHASWHMYMLVSTILMLAVTSLSITALVRQRGTTLPALLRGLTTYTFVFNLIVLFIIFIYGFISRMTYSMEHPGELPTRINFYTMPGFRILSLVADFVEIGLGLAGLIMTGLYLSRKAAMPTEPTATGASRTIQE